MDISLLVTTINLGTKSCGFAHQFRDKFSKDPESIASFIIKSEKTYRRDFPPAFILREGHAEEFGYQAIERFEEIAEFENGSECITYFENVLENLYTSEDFDDRTLLKDSRGDTHKALDIIGKFTKTLVDYFYHGLTKYSVYLDPSDIKWVLLIPSVRAGIGAGPFFEKAWNGIFWNDNCMREKLTIVAFPDAALTFYSYLPPKRCNGISIDKIQPGERVMVIGFEEEIDSLNIYEKIEDRNFKQVVHFLSGASSKCLILKAIDGFFEDLIGSWVWKVAKQNNVKLWQDIVSTINLTLLESRIDTNYVTFDLEFENLEKICDQHTNSTLKQIIETSEYSTKVKYRPPKIRVASDMLKSLCEKCLLNIVRNINNVLAKSENDVTTLILAGNIATSSLLIDAVQTAFSRKHIAVSKEANIASLKGAVQFGHKPLVVSSIFSGAQVMVSR